MIDVATGAVTFPAGRPRPHPGAVPRRPAAGVGRRRPGLQRRGPRRHARLPRARRGGRADRGGRRPRAASSPPGTSPAGPSPSPGPTPRRCPRSTSWDADGTERRLTRHTDAFHARCPAHPTERFTVPSPAGGDIDVWLVTPRDLDRTDGRATRCCSASTAGPPPSTASAGSTSSSCGPRPGSASCSPTPTARPARTRPGCATSARPRPTVDPGQGWGGDDHRDVIAALDGALERFAFLDPDRMGVLGGSYGGYMTRGSSATPTASRPPSASGPSTTCSPSRRRRTAMGLFGAMLGVDHLDDPDEYRRMSPITYVRDITTPMLHPPLRRGLAVPGRAGRQALPGPAEAGPGGRLLPLPGRGPRAVPLGQPQAPRPAGPPHHRLPPEAPRPRADPEADAGRRPSPGRLTPRACWSWPTGAGCGAGACGPGCRRVPSRPSGSTSWAGPRPRRRGRPLGAVARLPAAPRSRRRRGRAARGLRPGPTERVEVACGGGTGRTGTALACLAVLAGTPPDEAVAFVRAGYRSRAVETPAQRRFSCGRPCTG